MSSCCENDHLPFWTSKKDRSFRKDARSHSDDLSVIQFYSSCLMQLLPTFFSRHWRHANHFLERQLVRMTVGDVKKNFRIFFNQMPKKSTANTLSFEFIDSVKASASPKLSAVAWAFATADAVTIILWSLCYDAMTQFSKIETANGKELLHSR